jgi:hypothetical protein
MEKVLTAIAAKIALLVRLKRQLKELNNWRNYFIIVGDHGFVDIHSALSPNIYKRSWVYCKKTRHSGKQNFILQAHLLF